MVGTLGLLSGNGMYPKGSVPAGWLATDFSGSPFPFQFLGCGDFGPGT